MYAVIGDNIYYIGNELKPDIAVDDIKDSCIIQICHKNLKVQVYQLPQGDIECFNTQEEAESYLENKRLDYKTEYIVAEFKGNKQLFCKSNAIEPNAKRKIQELLPKWVTDNCSVTDYSIEPVMKNMYITPNKQFIEIGAMPTFYKKKLHIYSDFEEAYNAAYR